MRFGTSQTIKSRTHALAGQSDAPTNCCKKPGVFRDFNDVTRVTSWCAQRRAWQSGSAAPAWSTRTVLRSWALRPVVL